MKHWTVFDSPTADAAQQPGREVELRSDGTVAEALADSIGQQRTVVLVVPAGPDRATVARITPPQTDKNPAR